MLIILEGPDGAGKTTLANDVVSYLRSRGMHDVTLLHRGPPTEHPIDEYELPLLDYRPGRGDIICDRWHLGETIYPRVLKRFTRWDLAVERHMQLFLQSRGACVVGLTAPVDELTTRLVMRGDDLIGPEQILSIAKAYGNLTPHFTLTNDSDEIITPRRIVRIASSLERRCAALTEFTTYVGPPHPRLLLFGEVRGPHRRVRQTHGLMPAFCPYPATSGHFLLSHLNAPFIGAGLANACDVDDPIALWKALNSPPIVTLGRSAYERLTRLGVPHGAVPHPQYVRRFHHAHGYEYAHAIFTAKNGGDLLSWRP